jgi:hypothetical protein
LFRQLRTTSAVVAALAIGFAGSAHAASYFLNGGGAQLHIGNGLALPIQAAFTGAGTQHPPLLIKQNGTQIINGTTAMAQQQKITVPAGALAKGPGQNTVGLNFSNPTLYAVGTNLVYSWPTTAAVFSTGARTGAKTTTFTGVAGGSVTYSNPLPNKFGGPARFLIGSGGSSGVNAAPVTIYAVAVPPAGNPPCTHTALTPVPFPGPGSPACVAAIANAVPTGLAAPGAPTAAPAVTTPGGTPAAVIAGGPIPGVGIGKFGASPKGTVTFFTFTPAGTMMGFTNMATSNGFPWTTGKIVISAPNALGAPEFFTITGKDSRTAGGSGTIQMVAGAVSTRTLSGPNANRAWLLLNLNSVDGVPSGSEWTRGAIVVMMALLTLGYFAMRTRVRTNE